MNHPVHELPEATQQSLEEVLEPVKVPVKLLDRDDLPLAAGIATLPLLLGEGVFWPSCPMPAENQLATAKCFSLPTGEMMKIKTMKLCADNPPRYEFSVSPT
jgi:hypothetical protein